MCVMEGGCVRGCVKDKCREYVCMLVGDCVHIFMLSMRVGVSFHSLDCYWQHEMRAIMVSSVCYHFTTLKLNIS